MATAHVHPEVPRKAAANRNGPSRLAAPPVGFPSSAPFQDQTAQEYHSSLRRTMILSTATKLLRE
jgi:hypothetical protein